MGFHWGRLRYGNVKSFVGAMAASEDNQFEAMVRYIETDSEIHQAMRSLDFENIARLYNGPGFSDHAIPYDTRLKAGYERFKALSES